MGDALFGMGIEHVVSRTVRDSAAILDCIAGSAPGDPYIIQPAAIPYAQENNPRSGSLTHCIHDARVFRRAYRTRMC